MTNKKWFVIEKTSYGTSGDNFAISKIADTVEQATTYKVHLEALNESKNKFYFVASDISSVVDKVVYHHNKSVEEKPLILKDEVKETSSEGMPF